MVCPCHREVLKKNINKSKNSKNGVEQVFLKNTENVLAKCKAHNTNRETSIKVDKDAFCVSAGDVHAVIPSFNKFGYTQEDCSVKIIESKSNFPNSAIYVSPTVCVEPHGAKFFTSHPARIHLPVFKNFKTIDNFMCLCSDTSVNEPLKWRIMNRSDYKLCGEYIEIKTTHFSFFTAVGHRDYPEASKMIYAEEGGTLEVPGIPGIEVNFPETAALYDVAATVKVMFADEPYDVDHDDPTSYALAGPVIKLGPTGYKFNPESVEKVQVRLPLPDARAIIENCDRPYLTFWQSTTAEGQPLEWKLFDTPYRIDVDDNGLYSVYFTVTHFTFFKAVWSVLDSCVHEAKIGASFFYPHFEFCVNLQAFMSVNEDGQSFGLCVLGYRVGEPIESIGNYPIFVGGSGQRRITSGLHRIRIVSRIFAANTDLGEAKLEQEEFFTGRSFDKQFGCKYLTANVADYGTIGKVYFEKIKDDGSAEQLFDFLLIKPRPGQEMPQNQRNNESRGSNEHHSQENNQTETQTWETELSKELAALLSIKTDCDLGDDVWKDVALALGYKPVEIDLKFKNEDDPWTKLLEDYKNRRGASPNDFITAMYEIGRKEKAFEFEQRIRRALPESERDSVGEAACARNGSLSPSRTSSTSGIVLPPMSSNVRKRRHSIEQPQEPVPSSKLLDVAKEKTVQEKWKNLGRSLGVDDNQLLEIERNYESDGILEKTYQMFLAWKERFPESGHEELVQALGKWHLNGVARKLFLDY